MGEEYHAAGAKTVKKPKTDRTSLLMELEINNFWTPVHVDVWMGDKFVSLGVWIHSPHWIVLIVKETQVSREGLPSQKSTEIFQHHLICFFNGHQDLSGWPCIGPIP